MTNVIFWDRAIYGALLLLAIFIPYSPAVMEAGLLIMVLAWLIKRSLIAKVNPKRSFFAHYQLSSNSLQWPLLLIGLLIILTLPFSHDPALTFKKFFSRFIQQIILMYFVIEAVTTPKRLYGLMTALLSTFTVVVFDIFIQYFSGKSFIFHSLMQEQRVTGPMHHSNDLGTLLIMILPILLCLLLTRKSWISLLFGQKWIKPMTIFCGILFICLIIALGLTASRGAWLAFTITFIGFGLYLKNYRLTGLIVLSLILFIWIFGLRCMIVRTDISPGLAQATTLKNSSQLSLIKISEKVFLNPSRRFEYWTTASKIIERYPLFGCGYNTYIQTLQQLDLRPQEYPHNSIMHIAAEVGLVGLAGYLWFWLAIFFDWQRALNIVFLNRELSILGVGIGFSLLAWLLHSFTDTAWESLPLSIFWWMLIGVLLSLATVSRTMELNHKGA